MRMPNQNSPDNKPNDAKPRTGSDIIRRMARRFRKDATGNVSLIFGLAAMATLWGPLRQAEDEVQAQSLCFLGQGLVVVKAPGGGAGQGGRRPAAILDRQEQTGR